MTWHFPPYSLALLFSAALAAALALVGWRRRAAPGSAPFALLMLALALWALMSALEKAAPDLPAKILCSKIQYVGIMSVPPLWLLFALGYSRQDQWLTRRNVRLLWIMPTVTVAVAATNDWHRLLWTSITPTSATPGAPLVYAHGPWFWIAATYNYVLLLAGALALIWALVRFPHTYRRQAVAILVGIAIPWMGNVIYLTGLTPFPGLDLTPFAFTLTGLVFVWTFFRFRLFDLVPVAREAVIESMEDGVFVLDAQNRLVDINPAALRMIGAADASAVGQSAEAVFAAWPDLVAQFRDVVEARTELAVGGAAPRYLDLRLAPLRDFGGRITGRLVVVRDITARKQLEHMRDDLTHTMVHDLRNPLASIVTALDMLAEKQGAPRERLSTLAMARAGTRRMVGLINAILDISQLESGHMPLRREAVEPRALVAEAVHLQTPLAREKKVRLVNRMPRKLSRVDADEGLIARVLENLIGNAVKFTPEGGTIHVTARVDSAGGQLAIAVSDTGPGISPELGDRLFQKFGAGSGPARGSGLGLAFCRLAVEAHGGRIWAESPGPQGATFTFTLPLADKT